MGALAKIIAATLLTGILIGGAHSVLDPSLPKVLGMDVVCSIADPNSIGFDDLLAEFPCWFAFGGGRALLVVGLAGMGLVSLTLYGVGLFFATGQLALGLMAFGQAGVGVIAWIGQVGAGLTGVGQLIFGVFVQGQLPIGANGAAFHESLGRQLDSALDPPGRAYDLDPAPPGG